MPAPDASRSGEFDLIARYFAPMAGPGGLGLLDDAAVLTPPQGCELVLSKDVLVAGVHFFADDPADAIARKALRVNLSDLAAKGAQPLGFLLGLGLPQGWTEAWLEDFSRGLADDVAEYACPLLGGDTVSSPERLVLSVTVLGSVPTGTMVRRAGGQPGDVLYVSGTIGDGALGLQARMAEREGRGTANAAPLVARYLVPQPRIALAPVLQRHASAAMDVSDGLIGDATKLAQASGCGLALCMVDVPLSAAAQDWIARDPGAMETAVTGGDDYEILCAVRPDACREFESAAQAAGVAVSSIGHLTREPGTRCLGQDGQPMTFSRGSFRHF